MAHRRQVNPYGVQHMGYGVPAGHYGVHPAAPVQRRRAPQHNVGQHVAPPRSHAHQHPQQHGHVSNPGHSRPNHGHPSPNHGHPSPNHGHPSPSHVVHHGGGGGHPGQVRNVYNVDNHRVQSYHPQTQSYNPQTQYQQTSSPTYGGSRSDSDSDDNSGETEGGYRSFQSNYNNNSNKEGDNEDADTDYAVSDDEADTDYA